MLQRRETEGNNGFSGNKKKLEINMGKHMTANSPLDSLVQGQPPTFHPSTIPLAFDPRTSPQDEGATFTWYSSTPR